MQDYLKITTTERFENGEIIEYLKPVISHSVIGMNIFKDILSSLTDIVGGSSNTYENTLESINEEVLRKLQQKAKDLGANCILNLRIENNEISSGGKSMLMVTAVGTAAICDFKEVERYKKIEDYQSNIAENRIKIQAIEKAKKENQDKILIEKYHIIFKDGKYHLGDYKYSKLEDALDYAMAQEKKKQ